jgi:hypothetical protein
MERHIDPTTPRVRGISLDRFGPEKQPEGPFLDGPIVVTMFNAGGVRGGAVIGGCQVHYTYKRDRQNISVEYRGQFDP